MNHVSGQSMQLQLLKLLQNRSIQTVLKQVAQHVSNSPGDRPPAGRKFCLLIIVDLAHFLCNNWTMCKTVLSAVINSGQYCSKYVLFTLMLMLNPELLKCPAVKI